MESLSDDEEVDFNLDCDLDEDSSSISSEGSVIDPSDEETYQFRSRSSISERGDKNGCGYLPADSTNVGGNVQWSETFTELSVLNFNQIGENLGPVNMPDGLTSDNTLQ